MNELRRIQPVDADDSDTNNSGNPTFHSVLQARLSRRQTMFGGLSATTLAIFGGFGLAGCSDDDDETPPVEPPVEPPLTLGFAAVAKHMDDVVAVPAGYTASVLYRLGDPIAAGVAAYANDGTDADFDKRAGDHHDGMHYFGLSAAGARDDAASDRGLLVMNHENITPAFLHPAGPSSAPRPEAEATKEIQCHGVGIVEIRKNAAGAFAVVQDSGFNRRITPFTPMDLSGPVRGSKFVVTKYSTAGTRTRGTINNCANGYTPWGTYLTCEENWAGYFKRVDPAAPAVQRSEAEKKQLQRYGVSSSSGNNAWSSVTPDTADSAFGRFNASISGSSSDGSDDFRNEPNTYGYIVEIDPYQPASTPRKRTALGRFGHEGCWPGTVTAGQPVVFYMGDDGTGEYVYKFVSDLNWDAADANGGLAAGDKYMDAGTLYVAKFNADGSGEWIALVHGSNGLNEDNALYPFTSQAAVIVATRLAADSIGATRMDRPEWCIVNPANGEVYLTLTNSGSRGKAANQPVDAANPRSYDGSTDGTIDGNPNGHIIRWKEDGDSPVATTFRWDIYLFGSQATVDTGGDATNYAANVNISGLTDDNDFSSPDGFGFSPNGLAWIQTDDGAYTDTTNCMILAAVPGTVGDGGERTIVSGAVSQKTYVGKAPGTELRRFLVGPEGCELTGLAWTPDGKTMFANIQHPEAHWPDGGEARPRSATLVITRNDGGVIGV